MFIVEFIIFFFKQKTAYEVRISDWSSDVCSSDLTGAPERTRTSGLRFRKPSLYPAELRGRGRSGNHGRRRGQLRAAGGTTGNGSGATGTPSSASALASAGVAWPWIVACASSQSCIARARSADSVSGRAERGERVCQ